MWYMIPHNVAKELWYVMNIERGCIILKWEWIGSFKKIMMITYIPKTKHMKMKKSVDLSSIQKGYDFNI